MTKWIAVPLFCVGLLAGDEAEAQIFHKHRGYRTAAAYATPASTSTVAGAAVGSPTAAGVAATTPATTPYPSYSYYAAYPNQARGYVGYNNDDFAFHGQAYGHPYDKWTWPYMTGSNATVLARYYDPPVK